jgi:FAD/FMN-containing dehydrogenase
VGNSTDRPLNRRSFLGAAAAGGAAAAIAVTMPPIARAASLTGPTPGDWTALASDLAGPLVRPGDAGYPVARRLFDPRFDWQRPAGVAYVKHENDVSTCLAFVRKYQIPVTARCGGHSYAGWSGTSGLIIDVQDLKGVQVSGTTARVGAGTRLIDFYSGLAAHGRAVPGGSCPTVGISGLTLGGGVGVTARAYGLTCDALESVDIVTADGQVLTANATEHPDLYWACRGGGGGNFGIAAWFNFRTQPAPEPVIFFLSWPWSQAAKVVAAWQSWAPTAPDALWSNLHLAAAPGGSTPTLQVGGTYLGSIGGAANLLDQLYAKIGAHPAGYFLNQVSFLDAMLVEAGCSAIGAQACHLPWYAPGGQLSRAPQFAKSDYFTQALSGNGIATLLHGIESLQDMAAAPGGVGGVAFDALGGAGNPGAPPATPCVAHRNALFGAQYTTEWTYGAAAPGINSQHAWLRGFWTSMRPYASGQAYQNYIDPDLTNWRTAYYGQNLARLETVKKTYDPTRLFTFPQAI